MHTYGNLNRVMVLLLLASAAICSTSCDKKKGGGGDDGDENLPILSTLSVTGITHNSANLGGNIIAPGSPVYTEMGVCYSETPNPTTNDYKFTLYYGATFYVIKATGLSEKTTYYVRAYATNAVGTAYGNQVSFTTLDEGAVPIIYVNEGADIIIDFNNLSDFTLPVVVTCAKEDLVYVSVYIQGENDSQCGLDFITEFENPKVWTKTYTATDVNTKWFGTIPEGTALTFNVTVTTADGQFTASIPIEVVGSLAHPLEGPEYLTWYRLGSTTTGLAEFGLKWYANRAEIHAQITKDGADKMVLLSTENWDTFTTKAEVTAAIDAATDIETYTGINLTAAKIETGMNVLGVKYNDMYYIINLTQVIVRIVDAGTETIATGEYKY